MESNTSTWVLAGLAGLFFLAAFLLLAGIAVYNMRKASAGRAAPSAPPAPPRRVVPAPAPPVQRQAGNLPAASEGAFEEEEMPTVVVNHAVRPPPQRPAEPARAPEPAARTRGATIIAFDEDDDEDR